ncbi:MAG: hypothetical protein JW723_05275 [Bacteroidales bacterium]|nr:hypothetical protein [Bacteroidales bacterium]
MKYFYIPFIFIPFNIHLTFPQQETDSVKMMLEDRIEQLEKKLEQVKEADKLQELLDDANRLAVMKQEEETGISKKFFSGTRQQQGLNPNISLLGDFFGAVSSSDNILITEPGEFSYGSNGMFMRGLEMTFESALDPFARGKVIMHLHQDELEVEEAYIELLNLPLNLKLKTGIFYTEYGLLNRYHTHALPQFDRPRVAARYFGIEGLGGVGAEADFMLPCLLFAHATSLDISVTEGSNDFIFTTGRDINLLYTAHFKNYYDISESSFIEYCISGAGGRNDTSLYTNSFVGSFGVRYKWMPPGRSKYRTLDWNTEFYHGIAETTGKSIHSNGFYSSIQNKLNARFWICGRIGYAQMPYDNKQYEWDYTICFDYWQSEFVFFRLQYQYNHRYIHDIPAGSGDRLPSDHSLIVQVSWAMGPHKHEAY